MAILPAVAADKPCTKEDAAVAEKAADAVTSWAALQRVVRDYRQCDTGQAATVLSDALLRVVIDGWPKLGDADPILEQDAAFREWVAKRLGSKAIAKEDAQAISDLAKGRCPKARAATCEFLLDSLNAGKPMELPKLMEMPKSPAPAK